MGRRHQVSKRFRQKKHSKAEEYSHYTKNRVSVPQQQEQQKPRRSTVTPSHVQPGDMFIMRDNRYNAENKGKESSDTQVIRYDRPVVVMATNRNTVNVLALSTKERPYDAMYPLVIEKGLESFAIVSQPLTVDFDTLSDYIGTLRPDVFHDIQESLSRFILHGTSHVKRTVSRYEMDMVRYEPFGVYEFTQTGERYMVLKTKIKNLIKIPVEIIDEESVTDTDIKVFCGHVRLSTVRLLSQEELNSDDMVLYIGEEYRKTVRNRIVELVNEFYGIRVRNCLLKEDSRDIQETMTMAKIISPVDYINGIKVIDDICHNHVKQYLDDPQTFVKRAFRKIKTFSSPLPLVDIIDEKLVTMSDILLCDTRILSIGESKFDAILEQRLRQHTKGFTHNDKGVVVKYNCPDRKYYLKNVRWIYKYNERKNKA